MEFDLHDFISIPDNLEYMDVFERFDATVRSFISFISLGDFRTNKRNKEDIKAISVHLDKISTIVEQNICVRMHVQHTVDKFVESGFPDGLSYKDCRETNKFMNNISKIHQIFAACYTDFGNQRGRKVKRFPSLDAIKETFVNNLYYIYFDVTGKKPTPRGGGSSKNSDFIIFAKSVLNAINDKHPGLENGHNISLSFNDCLKRRAKKNDF